MFGYVMAARDELTKEEQLRYGSVYCGICRQIRQRASGAARLGLQFDMAFLALLLMSLYEPEETSGKKACGFSKKELEFFFLYGIHHLSDQGKHIFKG